MHVWRSGMLHALRVGGFWVLKIQNVRNVSSSHFIPAMLHGVHESL